MARRILVPQPGIEPLLPAVEAQSLNHCTAREIPTCSSFLSISNQPGPRPELYLRGSKACYDGELSPKWGLNPDTTVCHDLSEEPCALVSGDGGKGEKGLKGSVGGRA